VQAGRAIGADPRVGTGRALVAGVEQPQAGERDVLVLDQASRAKRQEILERSFARKLEQKLAKRVRRGSADI
jgi:hypothetical protein